jgi:hypothetical protein
MAARIRCECGWEHHAMSSDELVAEMNRHVADAHPDLASPPARADVLAMVEEVAEPCS